MAPTLKPSDYILTRKLLNWELTPQYVFPINIPVISISFLYLNFIQKNDVVVFEPPLFINGKREKYFEVFVKRCIGIPGDTIKITDRSFIAPEEKHLEFLKSISKFCINQSIRVPMKGDTIKLSPELNPLILDLIRGENHKVISSNNTIFIDGEASSSYIVRKNYFFMMGDNKWKSVDSRMWGFIPDDHIIGEVILVIN